MESGFNMQKIAGATLTLLTLFSVAIGLAGIWGYVSGDTGWQLFGTAVVMGLGIVGASAIKKNFQ